MKINNINKKLLAGILGAVILTTPLGLTACGFELNAKNNSYEKVNNYVVLTLDTKNGKNIWLTEEVGYSGFGASGHNYYDVFTGEKIIVDENGKSRISGIELINRDNFQQYLIGYDYVKKEYTKEEIEVLFNKIKEDFYEEEKENVKVKK